MARSPNHLDTVETQVKVPIHLSRHAKKRLQQRAISQSEAEFIYKHGKASRVVGGADSVVIPRCELRGWIDFHREEARRLKRIERMALISEGEVIITVKHCY